jgi:transcription elongation GreA/GreB family factor
LAEIDDEAAVQVGSTVRIRSVRTTEEARAGASMLLNGDHRDEAEITIVASAAEAGPNRLTPRAPLARALLGRRPGDVVEVRLEQVSAEFEVVSVSVPARPGC